MLAFARTAQSIPNSSKYGARGSKSLRACTRRGDADRYDELATATRADAQPQKGVLSDTGPAIMISALTNMSADAVGAFTSSPEITLLCYGNAACIFVDFVYQITLYSAVMVLAGHFEVENEREQSLTQRVECGAEDASDSLDQKSVSSLLERLSGKFSTFLDTYVSVVTNKVFDLTMVVVWIIFLGISIKGITQMPINLTPKKLFSKDSSLQE
ncbi:hypothetical protein ANCDUO_20184, partial [Ancylostoma duodenale]